ncbi:MAG TPA: D-alanyl-D-alanine carboxypeptidase family protein [Oscillospiraceae bacterium]|nr:D-alanyl-D-alanine carboxypeptidase family protein [Oscillospiraceae bacterium]
MKRFLCAVCALVFLFCLSTVGYAGQSRILGESSSNDDVKSVVNAKLVQTNTIPFEIDAKSAILVEVSSGRILFEKNPDEKLYPASITKIMTMLLVAEAIDSAKISLEDKVTTSATAASKGGSQIWLKEGEVMSVHEMLKAVAIGSANDAATALGEHVSGSETAFVGAMNARAKELNMENSHFDNATGLDDTSDTHLTTARDIAIMSRELLKHKFIEEYTTVWMDSLRNGETELVNTNKLVRFYNGTTGLKTGTTGKAGHCISASARREGLHLIAVVLGSDNGTKRFEAAKAMLTWGFSNYMLLQPQLGSDQIENVDIFYGETSVVTPEMPKIEPILVLRGKEQDVTSEIEMIENVEAPVEQGQTLGKLKFISDGEVVAEYNLTSPVSIKRLSFFLASSRIIRFLATGTVN